MTDDYFSSSLESPQETTALFADLIYNTGLTLEEATWTGGLLPSTDPASSATLQSVIFLDPAFNIGASGGLDLSMRVRLEAAGAGAVPEPAAMLLALLGLAMLPRRRRQ
jgi:MYXO-CTERM domain-containing protein